MHPWRWFFYLGAGALWLLTTVLALEAFALAFQIHLERANPLIADFREAQPRPEPEAAESLAVKPMEQSLPQEIGGWDSPPSVAPSLRQVLDWGVPDQSVSEQERMKRRLAFPSMPEIAKEAYARMTGELIFEVDKQQRVLHTRGSLKSYFTGPRFSAMRLIFPSAFRAAYASADAAIATGQPQVFTIGLPSEKAPETSITAAAAPTPDGACLFIDLHWDRMVEIPEIRPSAQSPWEIRHFRFKPNFQSPDMPGFQTNQWGFRDREASSPKPAGAFRVVCIGGSTTEEGQTNETTYPKLLEARLQAAFPEKTVEVFNAGTSGVATEGHLLRLPEYLALEPDLVVLHIGVNDVIARYNTLQTNLAPTLSRFVRMFMPSLRAPTQSAFEPGLDENMGFNLDLLITLLQERGAAVALAAIACPDPAVLSREQRRFFDWHAQSTWHFPAFSLKTYADYIDVSNRLIRGLATRRHALFIPIDEALRDHPEVFVDFCHMNPIGIDAKAEVIFQCIQPLAARRLEALQAAPL